MSIQISNQDFFALREIIPEHIKDSNTNLRDFLEAYYSWLQSAEDQPSHIINKVIENRDVDRVSDLFIDYLRLEFASGLPLDIKANPRKVYKQINDMYRSKGSVSSYEALFNLLFNEEIELYYPRVDILKPSDGKWDQANQRYINNDGFISDKKYIQDSYYYQSFSYVIKTGQTIDKWRSSVKKLLHPSGFELFGQVLIQTFASKKYSQIPPGFNDPLEGKFPIILNTVIARARSIVFNIAIERAAADTGATINAASASFSHLEESKFLNPEKNSVYGSLTFVEVNSGKKTTLSFPSQITLKPL